MIAEKVYDRTQLVQRQIGGHADITLAASSTLEYGAQSCGIPISCLQCLR